MTKSIISFRDRLDLIVSSAYEIICNKIAGGEISVHNEASLQLQIGSVIKNLGYLYEFSSTDHFSIELETYQDITETAKTKGRARCDIELSFISGKDNSTKTRALIELKFFKVSETKNSSEATKDNRFAVLMDIENLEHYQKERRKGEKIPLCYEIVFAENSTYADPLSRASIKIGEGQTVSGSIDYGKKKVSLTKQYQFHWDYFEGSLYSLLLKI